MTRNSVCPLVMCLATIVATCTTGASFGQFGGGEEVVEPPIERPHDMISLTLWALTVSRSAEPEKDALVGKLIDRANTLPPVIGTSDEARDLVNRLNAAGLLSKSHEIRLLTLDGETGSAQSGADEPSVVGSNLTQVSQSNSIQYRTLGTIVEVTPRINTQAAIQVRLVYSSSHSEKSSDIALLRPKEGEPILANRIVTHQVNSIARIKSGTAVLIWSNATRETTAGQHDGETQLILLAATVLPTLELE